MPETPDKPGADSKLGAWLALALVVLSTLGLFAGVFQIASGKP
jgi:hypothetical protein